MPLRDPVTMAADLLYREADYLDQREWAEWLALYTEDTVYWVPAWLDETRPTSDPDRQISQIYHDSRRGLEERVARVKSRKSVTAMPLPRTTHFISNVVAAAAGAEVSARANWMVQVYDPRTTRQHANFGRYEILLTERDGEWRIRQKKIVLNNDCVPTLIDFYTL